MLSFKEFITEQTDFDINKVKVKEVRPSVYHALYKGRKVGQAMTWNGIDRDTFEIYKSATAPEHQRKGVMRKIYSHIEQTTGKQLKPSPALSDDGHAFWQKYRPEAVANDLRNHRDKLLGKEVTTYHGPGRIKSVGPGGAIVALHGKETTSYVSRADLKKQGHIDEGFKKALAATMVIGTMGGAVGGVKLGDHHNRILHITKVTKAAIDNPFYDRIDSELPKDKMGDFTKATDAHKAWPTARMKTDRQKDTKAKMRQITPAAEDAMKKGFQSYKAGRFSINSGPPAKGINPWHDNTKVSK